MKWPLNFPVLSDGVVTLRAHIPTDTEGLVEMANDPEMRRWTSIPVPSTREMSEQYAFTVLQARGCFRSITVCYCCA